MIVRDEAQAVGRALRSAAELADCFVVLDTGSRDDTIRRAKDALATRDHRVIQSDWKGFASSRNEALSVARQLADYVVFLDADDVFFGDAARARAQLPKAAHWVCHSYHFWIRNFVQFAIRSDEPLQWVGERHEFLQSSDDSYPVAPRLMKSISTRYTHTGYRSRRAGTWQQDLRALKRELKSLSDDSDVKASRNIFHQAQTLQMSGDLVAAKDAFDARAEMEHGDAEERWVAELYAVRLSEILEIKDSELASRYAKLLLARPQRGEAYLDLARRLRLAGRFGEAERVAGASSRLRLSQDWIGVDTAAHSVHAWDEQASNLFSLGEFESASKLWRRALFFGGQPAEARQRMKNAVAACCQSLRPANAGGGSKADVTG